MSKIPAIFAEEKESKVATLSTEQTVPKEAHNQTGLKDEQIIDAMGKKRKKNYFERKRFLRNMYQSMDEESKDDPD